jgi:hypothetical protein
MGVEYLTLSLKEKKTLKRKPMFLLYTTLVRKCRHSSQLESSSSRISSANLPLEIIQLIQSFIDDTPTWLSWAKAFKIPFCENLFCQVVAEQNWLENPDTRLDFPKSIAETEFSKNINDLRHFSLLFPTTYKITQRDNGFAVTSYKKHLVPFDYNTIFSTPTQIYTPYLDVNNFQAVQNDPAGRHFVYTPYRIIHIYHPHHHKHFLGIQEKLPRQLKKKFKQIQKVFQTLNLESIKIEPWTLCFHQTKSIWEPCQEWIDYLFMIYNFQQEKSQILKNYKLRVS